MGIRNHITSVETREEYRGNDPDFPGTYDRYTVYECQYCNKTFTLASDLNPNFELETEVMEHVQSQHPQEV